MLESRAIVQIGNYLIRREMVAYVKVEKRKEECRVIVIFSGHCSDILMTRPSQQQANELATEIMAGNKYLV